MPMFCCVVGCHSKGGRDDVKFYSLPVGRKFKHAIDVNYLTKIRREKWLKEINRIDWTENKLKWAMVCSKHFISGKPAALRDVTDPDWIPCLNLSGPNGPRRKGVRNRGVPIDDNQRLAKEMNKVAEPITKYIRERNKRCYICLTNDKQMFSVPEDPETRKKWSESLTNQAEFPTNESVMLCQGHFNDWDLLEDDHGTKTLKPNALPVHLHVYKFNKNNEVADDRKSDIDTESVVIGENDEGPSPDFDVDKSVNARCSVCYELVGEHEAIPLLLNKNYTSFGSILITILNVGLTRLKTEYCCTDCSHQVLACFELLIDLNVSAFLSCQRSPSQSVSDILKKGCDICHAELETVDSLSEHFMQHLLSRKVSDMANIENINTIEVADKFRKNDEKENKRIGREKKEKVSWKKKIEDIVKLEREIEKKSIQKNTKGGTEQRRNKKNVDDTLEIKKRVLKCRRKKKVTIRGKRAILQPVKNLEAENSFQNNGNYNDTSMADHSYVQRKWAGNEVIQTKEDDNLLHNMPILTEGMSSSEKKRTQAQDSNFFRCPVCDALFNSGDVFFCHCILIHEIYPLEKFSDSQKPWTCNQCSKKFALKSQLKNHGWRIHYTLNVISYLCQICKKLKHSLDDLRMHIRIRHSKQTPSLAFECKICLISFQYLDLYQNHLRSIHQIEDIPGVENEEIEYLDSDSRDTLIEYLPLEISLLES